MGNAEVVQSSETSGVMTICGQRCDGDAVAGTKRTWVPKRRYLDVVKEDMGEVGAKEEYVF